MMPTAISQVVEQVVRVAVILFVASLFGSAISDYYTMGTWGDVECDDCGSVCHSRDAVLCS